MLFCFYFWSENFSIFLKLYFIDYAITVVLIFPPRLPSTPHHPLPQVIPPPFSCPWVMCVSSLAPLFPTLYFTSPWLFCNYLFVLLNPFTSHPFSRSHPPISLSLTFDILLGFILLFYLLFSYSSPHVPLKTLPCPTQPPPSTFNPPHKPHCLCPWALLAF